MTITVSCQYTGIEFEAASARSKNHPKIARFLEEASKDRFHVGAYAKAKDLLTEAKGQSDNIDEIMVAVQDAFNAWCNGEAKATVRIVRQWKDTRRADLDRNINDLDEFAQIDGRSRANKLAPASEDY